MRTRIFVLGVGLLACLLTLPLLASAQEDALPSAPEGDASEPVTLQVEVELVNVTATVVDDFGQYVPGLTAEDFAIFEDGVAQDVSFFSHDQRVPVSLGIMVDVSGSMKYKLQQALQIAREVAMALSEEDEVFIMTFADDMNVLTDFTTTGSHIQQIFRGVRTGGDTHQFDSIALGLRMMENARHQKKVLLLLSDGFDMGSRIDVEAAEELLKRAEVLVYAIGIDDDDTDPEVMRRRRYHVYHYMLTRLTDLTGGRAFRVYTGRRYALQSLAEVLLEELHQQYTLSYYPTNGSVDASWREIEVGLRVSDTPVRHRPGYYIGGGEE
jgi:Ca-activated chloride channel family protein